MTMMENGATLGFVSKREVNELTRVESKRRTKGLDARVRKWKEKERVEGGFLIKDLVKISSP